MSNYVPTMELLALFTPEGLPDVWRVRLFPLPLPMPVEGLDSSGECVGIGRPNFDELDRLMLEQRAGYRKRRHPSGVTEVTANTRAGAEALCDWVAKMIVR